MTSSPSEIRREVPVHNRGVREDALGRQPIEPVPKSRTAFRLDQFLVRRTVALALTAKAPLAEEESALVEQPRVLGQRDSLDDARAPERRCRHRNVGSDIGTLRQDRREPLQLYAFRRCAWNARDEPYARQPSREQRWASGLSGAGPPPRLVVMIWSIKFRPSNASRA